MNCRDFHRDLTAKFTCANLDTPDMDARLLIQYVAGWSYTDFVLNKSDALSGEDVTQIQELAERRINGEPIDHVFGWREFYGHRFEISKDVLSPRPETEGLVEAALGFLEGKSTPRVLDLGTGSGAIIISILAERSDAMGVCVDVSNVALDIARKNAKAHNVNQRLELENGSWFDPVSGVFDLIVSNPPYITNKAMEGLSIEVSRFDPDLALRGGDDGLEAYRVILQNAEAHLKNNGMLLFEIGYDQGGTVSTLMKQAGFRDVVVSKDLAGHDRIVCGIRRDN